MRKGQNSPLLILALFAVAVAIVFHGWWPGYKADRDYERFMTKCVENGSIRYAVGTVRFCASRHSARIELMNSSHSNI